MSLIFYTANKLLASNWQVTRKFFPFFSKRCAIKGRGGGKGNLLKNIIYNLLNINKVIRIELGECIKNILNLIES